MHSLLNRLSVRNRIWTIVALFIGGIVLACILDVLMLREALWREKELKTRQLVESAYSVLAHYHDLQVQGALSEAAARTAAIGTIRAMRYEKTEYFWINDLALPYPRMVMHPTAPALDGQVLNDARFNRANSWRLGHEGPFVLAEAGMNLFQTFVDVVGRGGEGYATYEWPKPKIGGGATSELYPKLSYVRKFEPWGWLIGSGIYMDDVAAAVRAQALFNVLSALGGSAILLLFASLVARSIIRPLHEALTTMRQIGNAGGDLALRLPVEGHSEIAELASGFNDMLGHLQARDAELARHRDALEEQVVQRTVDLSEANQALAKELEEHKRAERRVRESRMQMRALLDATSESVLLLDPDGGIFEINAFAAQRFKEIPEHLVGKNFFDLIPPELALTRRAAVRQVADQGQPMILRDRRGAISFENSLYPVCSESGTVDSIAVYAKDVSEQQRTAAVEEIFHHLDTLLLQSRMDLETVAQLFCDGILPVFDFSGAWVARAEADGRLSVVAGAAADFPAFLAQLRQLDLRWMRPGAGLQPGESVIREGRRQFLPPEDFPALPAGFGNGRPGARSSLLLPLALRGKTWGLLALHGDDSAQLSGPDLPLRLAGIADRLGLSLESASRQEWLALFDTALAGVNNAVFITDENAVILWANHSFAELSGYPISELLGKNPRLLASGGQDADFFRRYWETIRAGRTWHGELVNVRPDGRRYTISQTITPLFNQSGEVTHYVALQEDISERKAAEERMRYAANFDKLTDLPNRSLFHDRLSQALALARRSESEGGALFFLDLDHFKQVNDQLGHAAGDELLRTTARRLRALVRESDTVARLGGDEFTIILNRVRDPEAAGHVAEKVLAALAEPLIVAGHELRIGASIGIALFPEHGKTIEAILEAADYAMYLAKKAGRGCYAVTDRVPAETDKAAATGAGHPPS